MGYLSVEANIGVGKSTLLPKLSEKLKIAYVEEDLSKEGAFLTALEKYNENKDFALELQTTINEYRFKVVQGLLFGSHIVERSMMSDIIFAKVMNDRGELSDGDLRLFNALAETRLSLQPPEVCVYLACDPEVSFKRMSERGRPEESNNTLEYITQLEDAHEDMLPDLCEKFDIPFLRLDYTHFMRPGEVAESILTIKRLTNARQVSIR